MRPKTAKGWGCVGIVYRDLKNRGGCRQGRGTNGADGALFGTPGSGLDSTLSQLGVNLLEA